MCLREEVINLGPFVELITPKIIFKTNLIGPVVDYMTQSLLTSKKKVALFALLLGTKTEQKGFIEIITARLNNLLKVFPFALIQCHR